MILSPFTYDYKEVCVESGIVRLFALFEFVFHVWKYASSTHILSYFHLLSLSWSPSSVSSFFLLSWKISLHFLLLPLPYSLFKSFNANFVPSTALMNFQNKKLSSFYWSNGRPLSVLIHSILLLNWIISELQFSGFGASLVAQMVKNLPTVQETWVWPLGWEDPLEEGIAHHSSILAWRISWTEEPSVHWVPKSQTRLSD